MQGYNVETTFPLLNVMRIFAHRNWLHTVKMFPPCRPLPMFFFSFLTTKTSSQKTVYIRKRNREKKEKDIYDKVYAFQRANREFYFGYELTKFQVRLNSRTESKTNILQVTWLSIVSRLLYYNRSSYVESPVRA